MADDENTPPPAPEGLGERGLRLWTDTLADLEMDPDELLLLEEACRLADELDEMGVLLANSAMLSKGSRGQPVANPLIREIRGHRLALSRVLRQLGATRPGEDEQERLTPSQRGRKAALARHHGARSLAPVRPIWPPKQGDAS
ncbi:hypothetical protein [Streptomyces sp. NPDC086519]|uniref:hypothetical protein n=1 Tax=Streptomyces sp. NPDC086519 TaxID=3154863 RepID=UPI0034206BA3